MYHPNYFNDKDQPGYRKECFERLQMLKHHITSGSLLDIGCSEGYYSFGLSDICDFVLGIEKEKRLIDICVELQKQDESKSVSFLQKDIICRWERASMESSEWWDTILYMSTHHHIIAQVGFERATNLLRDLSGRGKRMFFDMGQQNENCSQHQWFNLLPKTDDVKAWIRKYLEDNTVYNDIQLIGSSPVHRIERYLWKLENI